VSIRTFFELTFYWHKVVTILSWVCPEESILNESNCSLKLQSLMILSALFFPLRKNLLLIDVL
jgi:hypothetical protein